MKVAEMKAIIEQHLEQLQEDYAYVGLRFEDKEREVGEECDWSRNNTDREDERDFPEYGTDEYFEIEEMDGTSAWDLNNDFNFKWLFKDLECGAEQTFIGNHAYIIVGKQHARGDYALDDGEIVIRDATVAVKVY